VDGALDLGEVEVLRRVDVRARVEHRRDCGPGPRRGGGLGPKEGGRRSKGNARTLCPSPSHGGVFLLVKPTAFEMDAPFCLCSSGSVVKSGGWTGGVAGSGRCLEGYRRRRPVAGRPVPGAGSRPASSPAAAPAGGTCPGARGGRPGCTDTHRSSLVGRHRWGGGTAKRSNGGINGGAY